MRKLFVSARILVFLAGVTTCLTSVLFFLLMASADKAGNPLVDAILISGPYTILAMGVGILSYGVFGDFTKQSGSDVARVNLGFYAFVYGVSSLLTMFLSGDAYSTSVSGDMGIYFRTGSVAFGVGVVLMLVGLNGPAIRAIRQSQRTE